jgi:hypothetical protein
MHIAIGTPMYGGACTSVFTQSVMRLDRALNRDGGKLTLLDLGNESLIQRARNTIAWRYLNTTDASHLLFCDGDIAFHTEDLARMVAADLPIIGAPCPMKAINWRRVATAVKEGKKPEDLHLYTGMFNLVHLEGPERKVSAADPFEVKMIGTGFMLIQRRVFEQLHAHVDEYANRLPGTVMPLGARVKAFFPVEIVNDDLLSEDYGLCDMWRTKCGGSVWAAPWCRIGHLGSYLFCGSYKDQYECQ